MPTPSRPASASSSRFTATKNGSVMSCKLATTWTEFPPDLLEQPALLSSTLAASSDKPAQLSFLNLVRISVVASVRYFRVGLRGEPGMLGIVAKNPITFRTRHDIQ